MDDGPKKNLIIILIALVALACLFFVIKYTGLFSKPKWGGETGPESVNKIENVSPRDLEGFPNASELPLPAGATLTKVYRATSPNNQIQVTKTLTSPKSIGENFTYFKNVLQNKKYGWTVIGEVNESSQPNTKAIFAQNSNGTLSVNLSYNPASQRTSIDLSFLLK